MLKFFGTILGGRTRRTTRPARAQRPQARLTVEELTPRVLPSASAFGRSFGHAAHAVFSTSSTASSSATNSSSSSHAGGMCGAESATLAATLTDASGATGQASFDATTGTLKIQVQGATASTSLSVVVDGTTVGTVTTNASGSGQAKLSNVTAKAGSTITVGDLSGTFTQVQFTATLTGSTTGVTGSASYSSVKNQLRVSVQGAAASTTYNVTVNGVVVGQVTTNSSGKGKLTASPSGVTIVAGSTIAVSDTAGSAAILTGTFA
jgi:hypothetical protein